MHLFRRVRLIIRPGIARHFPASAEKPAHSVFDKPVAKRDERTETFHVSKRTF
jgi:hypothetical protein